MLGFAHPAALLLLPLAPAVAWWSLRKRRPALRYSQLTLLHDLPRTRAKRIRGMSAGLRGLVLALLILALANPRRPDLQTRIPVDGISVLLVLDTSNSMGTPDFGAADGPSLTRLEAAKLAFRLFAAGGEAQDGTRFEGRPSDRLGLVTFAAVPQTVCPLTLNRSVLLQVLDAQSVQSGLNAGTNIGDAMAEGVIRLTSTSENQKKVMILLSDGEHNKLGSETLMPFQAAQLAAKFAIPIYTIDCGGEPDPQAKPEEFKQRTDGRAVLQGVAELTNARSFVANSGADLQAVYQQIDQLERVQVQSDRFRRYQDYRPSCGILALGVLLLLLSLERTVWQRFPA